MATNKIRLGLVFILGVITGCILTVIVLRSVNTRQASGPPSDDAVPAFSPAPSAIPIRQLPTRN